MRFSASTMEDTALRRLHWRRNLLLIGVLLPVVLVPTFGVTWYARDLSFNFFGWPFSFWVASQGALLLYLVVVWFYARTMERIDAECGLLESPGE